MAHQPEALAQRLQVEDAVTHLFVATDERDWKTVQACFTDPFVLDMTSLVGGSPTRMTPAEIAAAWAEGLKHIEHLHHQVGNFQTTLAGAEAKVRCYGIAYHHRAKIAAPVKTRTFVGTYDFNLTNASGAWRISLMKFNLKFMDGNLELDKSV